MYTRIRCFSTKAASPLAVLRKRTGYPLSKCKEALSGHDNDLGLAEKWLKEQAMKEGWAKSDQGRPTQEGLIATLVGDNFGIMMEVNCETDFVAKNNQFLHFASKAVQAISDHVMPRPSPPPGGINHFESHDLMSMEPTDVGHGTLGDLMAENIGLFGENITLTRACHMVATGRGHIGWYVYNGTTVPGTTVTVGKYGCLVHIEPRQEDRTSLQLVGSRLGQHIVGMNPQGVGGAGGHGLLQQQFLYDNTVSVERWLESCDAHVIEFVRYAVGETKNF